MQHSGQTSQIFKTKKNLEIQSVRPTEVYVVKYKVGKMAKSLLKHHCYCPKLLMQTTKTAVCLQTNAFFHHPYVLNAMSDTLPIALTGLLE